MKKKKSENKSFLKRSEQDRRGEDRRKEIDLDYLIQGNRRKQERRSRERRHSNVSENID